MDTNNLLKHKRQQKQKPLIFLFFVEKMSRQESMGSYGRILSSTPNFTSYTGSSSSALGQILRQPGPYRRYTGSSSSLSGLGQDLRQPDPYRQSTNPYHNRNCRFGYYETRVDTTNVGGTNPVPIYNASTDLDHFIENPENTFEKIVKFCLERAYSHVLEEASRFTQRRSGVGRARDPENDYCQIRLLSTGTNALVYDLSSSLVPYKDVFDDFINTYLMMIQSEENKTLEDIDIFFQFRYTFVLHQRSGGAAVTIGNVVSAIDMNRSMASSILEGRRDLSLPLRQGFRQEGGISRPVANIIRQRFVLTQSDPSLQPSSMRLGSRGVSDTFDKLQIDAYHANKRKMEKTLSAQLTKESRLLKRVESAQPPEEDLLMPTVQPRTYNIVNPRAPRPVGLHPLRLPGKTITEEQRLAYNDTKRIKRANAKALLGQGGAHGIYENLKRKIFHHTSLSQYFLCSKAIMKVPTTWDEGFCLAMAFMRSEMRTYSFGFAELENILISESKPLEFMSEELKGEYITCPILEPFDERISRSNRNSFVCGDEIVLFNPYKRKEITSELKYRGDLSDEEVVNWYLSAQNIHEYVVSMIENTLDPNQEDSLQCYSDVFGVYICVYRMEVQGKRTNIYKPAQFNRDVRRRENIKVVSILLEDSHATSITSLREFLRTKASANRSGVYNYCLFCEKLATANNESIEEAKIHIGKCLSKLKGCLLCEGDTKMRQKQLSTVNPDLFMYKNKEGCWTCKLCSQEVVGGLDAQMSHVCYVQKPKELKIGDESNIYVYDLECAQVKDVATNVFIHEANLVCVRKAYPDANGDCDRHLFHTMDEFMVYVLQQKDRSRVYLAHNGSKYDVQFVIRYLEKNLIAHTFIPTPSSMHAYLSVTVSFGAKINSTFIDFRHFMPGSLKNIGVSFGLSVAKGDFPHHFNNGTNEHYVGKLPELNNSDDYWCLYSKRKQEDLDEFKQWYATQQLEYCGCESVVCLCGKKKWDFQIEIQRYCWLDVDVLAEACVKYRDNAMQFGVEEESNEGWVSKGIDPFQYLTIPQLALNLLLAGSPDEEQIAITVPKNRRDRCQLAIAWMKRKSDEIGEEIFHVGNNHREYFCNRTKRFLDGITATKKIFVCLNCEFHGCKSCYIEEIATGVEHPFRPGAFNNVNEDTRKFVHNLFTIYGSANTFITWECDLKDYSPLESELGNIMKERDMFYGGRTEVFSPYVNGDLFPDDDIKYHDVCSLYPYVCAFFDLPTGHPIHYFFDKIDRERLLNPNHPDRYFGFVRCRVRPNNTDTIGLLPHREGNSGRLEFPLDEMTGSWGTEELRLAIENGYEILDIYEVYHWSKEERSNTLLRGYVSFFLRMKQESEGWKKLGASSDSPNEEEQLRVQQKVFEESGNIARIRPALVTKNPVKRQMAKLFLNSLWGKFCQKPHSETYVVIHGYQQFADLWYNPNLDRSKFSFRHISGNTWKVKYCTYDEFTRPNSKYNIYLSSKVTEWARCILHRQMKRIGSERILYCDTDSLMFIWPKNATKLDGVGLGNWVDEYPDKTIRRLFALAPKFYYLEFKVGENLLKSKGIQMILANNLLIHSVSLGRQLLELFFPKVSEDGDKVAFKGYIPMQNMLMGINSTNANLAYGTMVTKHTQDKRLGPVFSKRLFIPYFEPNKEYTEEMLDFIARIYTSPKGFHVDVAELSRILYNYLF